MVCPGQVVAIQGNVIDKSTNQPIPGIEVKIALPDSILQFYSQPLPFALTGTADEKGNYKLSETISMDSIPLIATDIDGKNNGLYKPDTVYVDFKNAQHIGGGDGWFQGELVATANFKLETQDADE